MNNQWTCSLEKTDFLLSQQPLIACRSWSKGGVLLSFSHHHWCACKVIIMQVLFGEPSYFIDAVSLACLENHLATERILWLLQSFHLISLKVSEVFGWCSCSVYSWALPVPYSLHLEQLCVSALATSCCNKRLLWSTLRTAQICGHKHIGFFLGFITAP